MSKLRLSTAIILLSLSAILASAMSESSLIQQVEAQPYYDYYLPYYYPYSSSSSRGRYLVTISISSLPSDYSATVKIDDNTVGSIPGGSSKQFEVISAESHVIQVESYISGGEGTRYICREASWTLEKASRPSYNPYYYPYFPYYYPYYYPPVYYSTNYTTPYSIYYYFPSVYYYPYYYPDPYSRAKQEVAHSFIYEPEYMLTVENPHGQSVDKTGWKQKDAMVTLTSSERIEKSNVERSIFKTWNVDGVEMTSTTITLSMNAPHKATAIYQTQYYLEVKSELNHPQGSGWYNKDSEAVVSILSEVPMTGFWGSLGAKHVFENWGTSAGTYHYTPTAKVTVDKPIIATAIWGQDYSTAYIVLAIILIIVLAVILVIFAASRKYLPTLMKEKIPSALDTLNQRYTKGEITRDDYLKMKKDIEKT